MYLNAAYKHNTLTQLINKTQHMHDTLKDITLIKHIRASKTQ